MISAPVIFPFLLQSRQRSIQHQMKERLEESILHTITVAEHDLRWVKEGKEIALGNKLFDVKTIASGSNGNFILTGLFDDEETMLLNQMKKKQQEEESNGNKQLTQLFHLLQVLPDNWQVDGLTLLPAADVQPVTDICILPSPVQNIPTPPPQA